MTTKVLVKAEGAAVKITTVLHGVAGDRRTDEKISVGTEQSAVIHNTLSLEVTGGKLGKGSTVEVTASSRPVEGAFGSGQTHRVEPGQTHSFDIAGATLTVRELAMDPIDAEGE